MKTTGTGATPDSGMRKGRPPKHSTVIMSFGDKLQEGDRIMGIMFDKGRVKWLVAR